MCKKTIVLLCVFGLVLIYYIVMLCSTNSIVKDVENIMIGNISATETDGTPLSRYNVKTWCPDAKVEADVTRIFTIHNFASGYMYVIYSYKGVDKDGELLTACGPTFSRWKIRRVNGEWQVAEIQEAP